MDKNLSFVSATAAAVSLLLLLVVVRRGQLLDLLPPGGDPVPLDDGQVEQGQGGAALELGAALAVIDPSTYASPSTTDDLNLTAFLAMLRKAETGTDGMDAYGMMFGRRRFSDFSDHPRTPAQFTAADGVRLWTSAAGAYQFMAVSPIPTGGSTHVDTWDRLRAKLNLPDFSPASQDAAAVQLLVDCDALADIRAGRFDAAVSASRRIWASLPGAGYGQPERSLASLRTAYTAAGGFFA